MADRGTVAAPVLGFTLAREELLLLLGLLKVRTIPGLGDNPLGGLSEREIMLALSAAEHSLAARGLLRATGPAQAELDPVVAALVGACIVPDVSFLATLHNTEGEEARYYHEHWATGVTVEHSFPEPHLHTFRAIESREELVSLIGGVLGLEGQSALPAQPGRVRQAALDAARQKLASKALNEAIAELVRGGLADSTARVFAGAATNAASNGSIVRITHSAERISGFATLEGAGGLCLLIPEGDDDDPWVRIEPVTGTEARERLAALCATD